MGVDYRAMIYVGEEFENAYEAVAKWNKLFPNHPAKLIKEVKVY